MRIVQTLEVWYYFRRHHHHQQQQLVIAAQNNIEPNGFFVFGFCCFRRRNHNKATKKKNKTQIFFCAIAYHSRGIHMHSPHQTQLTAVHSVQLLIAAFSFVSKSMDGRNRRITNEKKLTTKHRTVLDAQLQQSFLAQTKSTNETRRFLLMFTLFLRYIFVCYIFLARI